MQLNSITPKENNQWLKMVALFLFLVIISITAYCAFRFHEAYQKMSDLYVDNVYQSRLQWGSEKHPYSSISKALEAASKKKARPITIHLRSGEYIGNIGIPENMNLYGESREKVFLKSDNSSSVSPIITLNNNAHLANITVLGGHTGILAKEQAAIENCSVKEFKKIGIDVAASSAEIIIKNSEISNSSGKGFYLQKGRKIQLLGNLVHDNKEEGIDLRQELSGEIRDNEIYKNEESGIEMIVGKSSVKIENNKIWDNGSNGIVFQYYDEMPEKGAIIVSANYIKSINSEEFAVSVKSPSGGEGRVKNYWRDSITITDDNVIEGGIKTRSLAITKK